MPRDVLELLHLRWRAAQFHLAHTLRDGRQTRGLRGAMRIEGITPGDFVEELELLRSEFGRNPTGQALTSLRREIDRLWLEMQVRS
ncbi:hypothetical protein [Mycolicibacterium pallens]|uniref:Uncharacterized protein n=1 Tax=Mycolicibacterium pallens TaxID=370524 RepID=A0ABX8VSS5_9MYCO|nr:hypothetical protein [Mycolicibacterium pallens]QYL19156.1 hypothetical protein K0O64_12085 [Mycolicibacterium pallens]